MKALIWNIRLVKTQKTFTRLKNPHKRCQFYFIGLIEPFVGNEGLEEFRRRLSLKHAIASTDGMIDKDQMLNYQSYESRFRHRSYVILDICLMYANRKSPTVVFNV
ncbi:hypothetical protein H5410_027698 [Solanum commersonii]|uniref:Uncharacterized protein n=1 Tax=Solanum commersonii TaxID=4109 RepID=A0A9J5Z585_SOLCO|nr:hypothetical protein H5410_027698 [Solanum commersonii]